MKKRAKYVAPTTDTEKQLAGIWSDILKIPASKIGIHDSFFDMGGDSLMAIQFVCEAEEQGIHFSTDTLFTNKTIADLTKAANDNPLEKIDIDQAPVSGSYPLLPRQSKLFADDFKYPAYWNRNFLFDIDHDARFEHLTAAFDAVLMHHDNLRIDFSPDADGKRVQNVAATLPTANYTQSHDLSALSPSDQEAKIVDLSNAAHADLDLDTAPLIRILHFKTAENAGKLGIIIHHLLLDIVASRIIFEDFLKSYEALRLGVDMPLAPKTTSAKEWSEYLAAQATTADFTEELAYWANDTMRPTPAVPVDHPDAKIGLESTCAQEKLILDKATTDALLRDIPTAYSVNIQDILLAALLQTTTAWTADNQLLVNICGHGRDGTAQHNLARTAAWLNTTFPVYLKSAANQDNQSFIQDVSAQINAVPKNNAHYNLLRYTAEHPEIKQYPTPEIFFNYVSQIDALLPEGLSFTPIPDPKGIAVSHGDNHLCYLLYLEAGVMNKRLNIHTTYSSSYFDAETIRDFNAIFKDKITKIVKDLQQTETALSAAE